jgi:hypothetical protein
MRGCSNRQDPSLPGRSRTYVSSRSMQIDTSFFRRFRGPWPPAVFPFLWCLFPLTPNVAGGKLAAPGPAASKAKARLGVTPRRGGRPTPCRRALLIRWATAQRCSDRALPKVRLREEGTPQVDCASRPAPPERAVDSAGTSSSDFQAGDRARQRRDRRRRREIGLNLEEALELVLLYAA